MGFDYRTSTGLGKLTLGRQKQNLVLTRTQEKGTMTPQETEPDFPVSVGASSGSMSEQRPAAGLGALNTAVLA